MVNHYMTAGSSHCTNQTNVVFVYKYSCIKMNRIQTKATGENQRAAVHQSDTETM